MWDLRWAREMDEVKLLDEGRSGMSPCASLRELGINPVALWEPLASFILWCTVWKLNSWIWMKVPEWMTTPSRSQLWLHTAIPWRAVKSTKESSVLQSL